MTGFGTWDVPGTSTGLPTNVTLGSEPSLGTMAGTNLALSLSTWDPGVEHTFVFPYTAETQEVADLLDYLERGGGYGLVRAA